MPMRLLRWPAKLGRRRPEPRKRPWSGDEKWARLPNGDWVPVDMRDLLTARHERRQAKRRVVPRPGASQQRHAGPRG